MADRGSFCRRILVAELVVILAALLALPFAGRLLYHEDSLKKSDAVFVFAGARIVRWLEASDLVRGGWAPEIALGGGYRESLEYTLLDKGVRLLTEGEIARSALLQLGHPPDRVRILGYTDNTGEEARMLRREAATRHWSRIIIVTSKLHTRRARIALLRAFEGAGTEIIVRGSRYDDDDPAHYWRKRRTTRSMLVEMPKLVAYWMGIGD